jgi:hypothetical protein
MHVLHLVARLTFVERKLRKVNGGMKNMMDREQKLNMKTGERGFF